MMFSFGGQIEGKQAGSHDRNSLSVCPANQEKCAFGDLARARVVGYADAAAVARGGGRPL